MQSGGCLAHGESFEGQKQAFADLLSSLQRASMGSAGVK